MNLVFLILNEFIIGLHTASRILKIVKDKAKYRLMFRDFVIFLGTHLYLELTTCAESFQKRFYFHFTPSCIYPCTFFFLFLFHPFLSFYISLLIIFSFEMLYLMAFCQKGRLKDPHISASDLCSYPHSHRVAKQVSSLFGRSR